MIYGFCKFLNYNFKIFIKYFGLSSEVTRSHSQKHVDLALQKLCLCSYVLVYGTAVCV